jgi:hypothetical protein
MREKYIKFLVQALLLILVLSISQPLKAQIGVNVYDEVVYNYLDKLVSSRLVKTYSPNQRPLSRYAVAKMVIEARGVTSYDDSEYIEQIIVELEEEFQKEIDAIKEKKKGLIDFRPINKFRATWTATDQPEEPMPNNGLGTALAGVQPLLAYKEGRHFNKYANFRFDTEHWLELTPYFSAYINPELYTESATDENRAGAEVHRGYLKGGYRNFEVQVGRDEVRWGPGAYGSLLFSSNPRGLDMIRATTPSTFRLPWVFRHLGQWRFTTLFSWMGTSYQRKNAILSAYRVDYQPFYWWDIGFDHAVFMGGAGAKDPNITTAIGEYVGFIFDSGNSRASSNHVMGFDMSFSIPPLRGLQLYGKVLFEDTNDENVLMFKHNASWLGGIYLPRADSEGKLSMRIELARTGEYAYRHGFYSSGFSIGGKFLGYDAGSDTYSGLFQADYIFNLDEFIRSSFRYLKRSSNTYSAVFNAAGNQTNLVVNTAGTKEYHYLFKVGGQKRLSRRINMFGEVGLDYTQNKFFVQGRNDWDFAIQVGFNFEHL